MPPAITPIDWNTIENALHAFVVAVTGFAAGKVIWANQKTPRPAYPYASMKKISGPSAVGIDEDRSTTGSFAGKPASLDVVGNREITMSIQVFGTPNSISPTEHATAYISALQSALSISLYNAPLAVAGLAVRGINPIELPDEQVADAWVSRGILDVRFGLVSNVRLGIDVIEKANIKAIGIDGIGALDPSLIIDQEFGE